MEQVLLHKILTISPLADAGLSAGATYAGLDVGATYAGLDAGATYAGLDAGYRT